MKIKFIVLLAAIVLLIVLYLAVTQRVAQESPKGHSEVLVTHQHPAIPPTQKSLVPPQDRLSPIPSGLLGLRAIKTFDYDTLSVSSKLLNSYQENRELLNKFAEGNQFSSWENEKSDLILINHDGWRNHWRISDKEGNIICDVPGGTVLNEIEFGSVYWLWKDNRSLVGSMYHDTYPNEDYDQADGARLFVFQIDKMKKTGKLLQIDTPVVRENHVVRIEGVTPEGYLVLSDVRTNNYHPGDNFSYSKMQYGPDEEFLGVFEVVDE